MNNNCSQCGRENNGDGKFIYDLYLIDDTYNRLYFCCIGHHHKFNKITNLKRYDERTIECPCCDKEVNVRDSKSLIVNKGEVKLRYSSKKSYDIKEYFFCSNKCRLLYMSKNDLYIIDGQAFPKKHNLNKLFIEGEDFKNPVTFEKKEQEPVNKNKDLGKSKEFTKSLLYILIGVMMAYYIFTQSIILGFVFCLVYYYLKEKIIKELSKLL
jgi:YHS domain-containing protein